ncbi:MAG: hypothetical protein ACRDWS_13970 [Acidimicrobiia bacterium]
MASGILELREKLGPILWQLSPKIRFDPEPMDRFLASLPHDLDGVADLAPRATLARPRATSGSGPTTVSAMSSSRDMPASSSRKWCSWPENTGSPSPSPTRRYGPTPRR